MPENRIMVQTGEYRPTLEAVHLASAIARNQQATLVLVEMIAVSQPAWLGTELGNIGRTERTRQEMESYCAVAEEYGVPVTVQPFQYITLLGAITDAADYVDARLVFVVLPKVAIPLWHRFRVWLLRQRLESRGRQLFWPGEERTEIGGRQVPFAIVGQAHHHEQSGYVAVHPEGVMDNSLGEVNKRAG
jgi:hypothetical protein